MSELLPQIPGLTCEFPRPDGFPRPDWERVFEWIDSQPRKEEAGGVFAAIEEAWADELGASISADYNSYVSDNVILLSPQFERDAVGTVGFCERVHAWLNSVLGPMAPGVSGRHVIVLFDEPDDYWEYCSWFCNDGEFANSSGMTIKTGCVHIAIAPSYDGVAGQMAMSHELLHSYVADRQLPLWLEEGVAQRCERHFFPNRFPEPLREDFERIEDAFDEAAIQRFWTGELFERPRDGDEQMAAYSLALILCDVILHDFSNPRPFFESATWEDAGESAAREHLRTSLAQLVTSILGPGNWEPRPGGWPLVES